MKLSEMMNEFYFEGSTIERILCKENEIVFEITFCVWAQDWYDEEKDNELEKLILTFKNVEKSDCRNYNAGREDLIKDCELIAGEGGLEGVRFSSWCEEGLYSVTVFAEEVIAEYKEGESWNPPRK